MDLTGWLEYLTLGLAGQVVEVRHRGEAAIRSEPRLSISDIQQRMTGADRRTLQRELRRMLDLGLVAHSGGRTDPARAYRIAAVGEPEL